MSEISLEEAEVIRSKAMLSYCNSLSHRGVPFVRVTPNIIQVSNILLVEVTSSVVTEDNNYNLVINYYDRINLIPGPILGTANLEPRHICGNMFSLQTHLIDEIPQDYIYFKSLGTLCKSYGDMDLIPEQMFKDCLYLNPKLLDHVKIETALKYPEVLPARSSNLIVHKLFENYLFGKK